MSKTPRTDDALSCAAQSATQDMKSEVTHLRVAVDQTMAARNELQRRLDRISLLIGEWEDDGGLLGQIAQIARGEDQP